MKDLLLMGVFSLVMWVFYRLMLKEPILPWKEKTSTDFAVSNVKRKSKKKKHEVGIEQEPQLFEELFEEVKDISNHMIRFNDNSFTLIGEVEPVNYFLKSQDEQEAIDTVFESWLASINYQVQYYFQNRFIDISEPIENMRKSMRDSEDLNEAALSFGESMIRDLVNWQTQAPRYETKRYLVFTHKINAHDISADSPEELDEKVIEKAFAELMRRLNAAKSQFRKAEMNVTLLPTEGIYELLYHTFNRRKAVKHRFKDIIEQEKNALYATADQSDERIEAVKEAIEENESIEEAQKERAS
ncbi:hypothetical protein D1B31_18045 [Neobacillus notoginsengisoli]|uniref:PXO1-76 n=1 Tax=Neobacillus notoginsengisoli TaxID=1578198 RepID=A0A417YQ64_9BACI|nr:hypothetical protein [Neobacillus notoginsengisoli]RHW35990.1 hypothetical protein D1B31_18045 [Neobacillus notoginsengisoli]